MTDQLIRGMCGLALLLFLYLTPSHLVFLNEEQVAERLEDLKARTEKGDARAFLQLVKEAERWTGTRNIGYTHAYIGVQYQLRGDHKEGAKWLRRAAECNISEAQHLLAHAYYNGQGVVKDIDAFIKWEHLSARNGVSAAQVVLGNLHLGAHGVTENPVEAARWFRYAAEQGHPVGQAGLAFCYYKGIGIERNEKEAHFWAFLAQHGDEPSYRSSEVGRELLSFSSSLYKAQYNNALSFPDSLEIMHRASTWRPKTWETLKAMESGLR